RCVEIVMIERVLQDLRFAGRTLRRTPGFALLALATMAIGIGANTAIFSIVNAVLLRPLPYPDAERLVIVSLDNRQTKQSFDDSTPANFLDWRVRNRSFEALAAFREDQLILTGDAQPERVSGAVVNGNFFDVLGVKAIRGRALQPADEGPGA